MILHGGVIPLGFGLPHLLYNNGYLVLFEIYLLVFKIMFMSGALSCKHCVYKNVNKRIMPPAGTKLVSVVNGTLDGFITSTRSFTNLVDRITLIMEPQYLPFLPVRNFLCTLTTFQFCPMPPPVRIIFLA